MSSFNVSVAAQGSGRLGYTVLVHLKNALLSGTYDYVEIRVAPSDKQIETVEIAGNVWMAFNARSRDLEDQIYPLDGATVEDMYHKSWINTVGGLFQFGRLYMYVPWQGYNPSNNLGNQTADAPWVNDTHMPCPEGYRIPTGNNCRYTSHRRRNTDNSVQWCDGNTALCEVYFGRHRSQPYYSFGWLEGR